MKRIFYLLTIVMLMMACADDDNFSTASGLRLTFTKDTVKMDTVFARTPSSTYSFWVHNLNDEGIRLSSIHLNRRNQTGFRVNVDGSYLDNALGSQVNDLEIRRNDSILVFVELTSTETSQLEPKLIEDDLVFTLESGVEQRVNLRAWTWDAEKMYDPVVVGEQTIESAIPIIIYGGLTVPEGTRLNLRNSTLYFHEGAGIECYGDLIIENCLLRGDRLDHMFDYLPYDRVSGQWKGCRRLWAVCCQFEYLCGQLPVFQHVGRLCLHCGRKGGDCLFHVGTILSFLRTTWRSLTLHQLF